MKEEGHAKFEGPTKKRNREVEGARGGVVKKYRLAEKK
jgi:hypothetical protein